MFVVFFLTIPLERNECHFARKSCLADISFAPSLQWADPIGFVNCYEELYVKVIRSLYQSAAIEMRVVLRVLLSRNRSGFSKAVCWQLHVRPLLHSKFTEKSLHDGMSCCVNKISNDFQIKIDPEYFLVLHIPSDFI